MDVSRKRKLVDVPFDPLTAQEEAVLTSARSKRVSEAAKRRAVLWYEEESGCFLCLPSQRKNLKLGTRSAGVRDVLLKQETGTVIVATALLPETLYRLFLLGRTFEFLSLQDGRQMKITPFHSDVVGPLWQKPKLYDPHPLAEQPFLLVTTHLSTAGWMHRRPPEQQGVTWAVCNAAAQRAHSAGLLVDEELSSCPAPSDTPVRLPATGAGGPLLHVRRVKTSEWKDLWIVCEDQLSVKDTLLAMQSFYNGFKASPVVLAVVSGTEIGFLEVSEVDLLCKGGGNEIARQAKR